ncbi:MAG TPA: hypothetical protein VFS92_06670 [Planctomycetota bacterium]|nr:hypothetical protein [Planctomycetota bacterium]
MRSAIVGTGLLLAALAGSGGLASGAEEGKRPVPPNPGPCPNDPSAPLPQRVNNAIDLGVAWLKKMVPADGDFGHVSSGTVYGGGSEPSYGYPAGSTALAAYTLLRCGVPPDDPLLVRIFGWLRKRNATPQTSYEISMLILAVEARAQAIAARDPPKGGKKPAAPRLPAAELAWIKDLVAQLVRRRQQRPGWRYNFADPPATGPIDSDASIGGDLDNSSTQLAMLALAAGERCGFKQPDETYLATARWLIDQQEKDGPAVIRPDTPEGPSAVADRARGWTYLPRERKAPEPPTGSMTACAMASLTIAGSILAERKNPVWLKGLADQADRAWTDGSAWFLANWSIPRNPNGSCHYYYLYCIERAGDLRGASLLGGRDWYTEGAQYLVDAQYPNGSWWGLNDYRPEELLGTCFALLFLKRATRAVATDR